MPVDETARTQLAENLRFIGDMRFKQLTLLLGGLTVSIAGVAQYPNQLLAADVDVRSALALLSMSFTALMWVMEVRSTQSWWEHRAKVPDLWPIPKVKGFSWLTATSAALALHVGLYAGWYWCAWHWYPSRFVRVLFAALGLGLFVFSVTSYVTAWRKTLRNPCSETTDSDPHHASAA